MPPPPLGLAIIGCGNISRPYARDIVAHPDALRLVGCYDLLPDRAASLASEFGCKPYDSLDAVLADPEMQVCVNLTIHHAHVEVTTRCLNAGKHVHTEKPLALDPTDAKALVALAKRKKLRLSAAPTTFLGEAQQTAWKLIRDGRLGTVRMAYAEMNWGRIESWHPNPAPFYDVGPLFDVGVYPLTLLTAIFGPVARVACFGKILSADRTATQQHNSPFTITTPDWFCGLLEFESGLVARLTADFYVGPTRQHGVEFHGDAASLHLAETSNFASPLQLCDFGAKDWHDAPLVRPAQKSGVDWARGLLDLADALATDRPPRATGNQAAHVVEILSALHKSTRTGRTFSIRSRFEPPPPMDWAK